MPLICSQSDSSKNIEHIQARSKVGITLPVKNEQENYRTRDIRITKASNLGPRSKELSR